MITLLRRFSIALAAATISTAGVAQTPVEGLWRNPSGTAIIRIAPCGGPLCGTVAWASERGQREVSAHAPKVVGTTVLTGLRARGDRWHGSLYIPDDNITVSAKLQLVAPRQMKLTGCAIAGLICRSQVWNRVDRLPN